MLGTGFQLHMNESEPWLWVHVSAVRTVDTYVPESHDVWIYKHLVYP